MTKHLRFLFVMLLAMIWSAGWAAVGDNFILVTDAKDLKAGDKIIIGSKASGKVLGADNGNDKRTAVSATFTSDGVVAWQEGFDVITLEGTASAWYLHSQAGYLKKGSGKTDIKTINVKAEANTSLISIDSNYDAHISFNGATGTREIRCNAVTNKTTNVTTFVFGHYVTTTTTTTPSQIYKLVNSGDTKTDTKVSFGENSGKTFTFTEGKYSNGTFTTPTATETNGIAGTVAYSSSNATAISVDASTGELTFLGYGEATITAKFTPEDGNTYAVSTDIYKVVNQVKKSSTVLTFSGDLKSFDKANNYEKPFETKDVPFVGSDGKTYIFNSNGGKSGSARFLLPNKKNNGKLVSPEFSSYINGYTVVITYGIGGDGYPSISANGETVKGTVDGTYTSGTGATLSLDVADGSAFTVTSDNALAISKIEITPNKVDETTTITLNETADNTIEAKTGVNVTLKRTMVANEWNTICLPFDVTAEQATVAFGEGVKIAQLDDTSTGNILNFVDMSNCGMEAAVPYLIKPTVAATTEEYSFKGVEIKEAAVTPTKVKTNGNLYFNGIYNKMDVTTDASSGYYAAFLGANNTIFKAKAGGTMKGFRAYFAIPKDASASALRVVIDGTATSIKNIDSEVVESNAPVYNLQGQRVNGNNLTPGIYVKAGKKFVVK